MAVHACFRIIGEVGDGIGNVQGIDKYSYEEGDEKINIE
jgi:hypothetical protein